jgi:hypothetical protein
LIEVKTTDTLELTFKTSYLEKLHAYAELLKQPLLIAWRPRSVGFWMLFDPNVAESLDENLVRVSLDLAIKNDLMSALAGDFYLVPMEGAGLRIEAKRIGEKQPTHDGYKALFQISDAYFHDAAGTRVANAPNSIAWMIFSAMKENQETTDDGFNRSFVASGGLTRAQLVLRTAVGFSLNDEERIHWKMVGKNLDSFLTCDALLADAEARFGSFVQYILHQQPQNLPGFFPKSWQGRETGHSPPLTD